MYPEDYFDPRMQKEAGAFNTAFSAQVARWRKIEKESQRKEHNMTSFL